MANWQNIHPSRAAVPVRKLRILKEFSNTVTVRKKLQIFWSHIVSISLQNIDDAMMGLSKVKWCTRCTLQSNVIHYSLLVVPVR